MTTRPYQGSALLALIALLVGVGVACKPTQSGTTVVVVRPECPLDDIKLPKADGSLLIVNTIAASGPISMVPEYHDCQRFVMGNGSFGPMIAIFASSGLDSVADPPPGPYSATNVVITGRADKAAATILNYDLPYEPLRIEHGVNCLYLATVNGEWKAHIVPAASDRDCLTPSFSGGSELSVSAMPGPKGPDIPPVARWDWDPTSQQHYIGIRCGSKWCEVYSHSVQTLHSSPHYDGPHLVQVKGWYDEQELAVMGNNGILLPGGVRGTVFPVGDLVANTEPDFDAVWKKVAFVSLSAPSPKYLAKFNFIPGPAPAGQSFISLCHGNREKCVPPGQQVNDCEQKGDPWWAQIQSGATTRYRCVVRRSHPGVPIPGAVRWRWQIDDEDMWIRCPQGCCQVT